jgi:hypothetical protein
MKRRDLLTLLAGAALSWPMRLDAQPLDKIRVGSPSV